MIEKEAWIEKILAKCKAKKETQIIEQLWLEEEKRRIEEKKLQKKKEERMRMEKENQIWKIEKICHLEVFHL